jgi:hypothetical protein
MKLVVTVLPQVDIGGEPPSAPVPKKKRGILSEKRALNGDVPIIKSPRLFSA